MSPILDLEGLYRWVDKVLERPEECYADERVVELRHNLFALRDFKPDPCTGGPVFSPYSECTIHVTPLSAAAYCGNEEAVKALLEYHDPHDNLDNVWITPLSLAYVSKNIHIIDLLKEHKRERNESHTPFTIMHAAARFGSADYIDQLHTTGDVEMTIRDMDGVTPAIQALYQEKDDDVKEVLSTIIESNHLAMDIKDVWINNWTCVDLAQAMRKSGDLVKWLWRAQRTCVRAEKAERLGL